MRKQMICDNYREVFTKEFFMGPNSMRLLEEMLNHCPLKAGSRVMDLGCGRGLTTLYLAKETGVQVYATDLWIDATVNAETFEQWGIGESVIPIHADVHDLPFARNYFDAIVSVDSYEYFGKKEGFFEEKIMPYLKKDGVAVIALPGLAKELNAEQRKVFLEWVNGDEDELDDFHTRQWWNKLLEKGSGYEILESFEMECGDIAWQEWFESGHEFGIRDKSFFERGMDEALSFIGLVIRRK